MTMDKYKVVFLLYLVASTHVLSAPAAPDFSSRQNARSHHLHKRDVEEIHSIDVHKVKEQLMQAYQEIRPLLDELVADIAPSIHEKISLTYLPAIGSFRDDVMPFFNAKVYPQIQKYVKFGLGIAEKLIEKTYTAYKLSNSTHLAVVSVSDLIDEVFNEIKPIVEMGKYLSARMMKNGQYRGKRDVSENSVEGNMEVHLIDIQKTKEKLTEAYLEIKPLLENLVSEIAPSVYEKFILTYLPKFQEIIKDITPFFQSKINPQVQKYIKFARSVAEKLVDKAYRSYQLSNSTHINIVSISDIIEEVYTEIKPVLDLGKYLSMRMAMSNKHYRGKRDVSEVSEPTLIRHKRQLPDIMMSFFSPVFGNMVNEFGSTVTGDADSLISKVVIPVAYDILSDPESTWDVFHVLVIAKSAYAPLIWEMMKRQTYNSPKGTIIKIPRQMYEQAEQNFQRARPTIYKLMDKYMPKVLKYAYDATPQVIDFFDHMIYESYAGVDNLKDHVLNFMQKHREMFRSSTSSHVHYYSMKEIKEDFVPITTGIINLFFAYVRRNPHSFMNLAFGENGLLHKMILSFNNVSLPNFRPATQIANTRLVARSANTRLVARSANTRPVARVARPVARVATPVRYVRRYVKRG